MASISTDNSDVENKLSTIDNRIRSLSTRIDIPKHFVPGLKPLKCTFKPSPISKQKSLKKIKKFCIDLEYLSADENNSSYNDDDESNVKASTDENDKNLSKNGKTQKDDYDGNLPNTRNNLKRTRLNSVNYLYGKDDFHLAEPKNFLQIHFLEENELQPKKWYKSMKFQPKSETKINKFYLNDDLLEKKESDNSLSKEKNTPSSTKNINKNNPLFYWGLQKKKSKSILDYLEVNKYERQEMEEAEEAVSEQEEEKNNENINQESGNNI